MTGRAVGADKMIDALILAEPKAARINPTLNTKAAHRLRALLRRDKRTRASVIESIVERPNTAAIRR
jgi:hypothetical protein